jgi:hypothetical protein
MQNHTFERVHPDIPLESIAHSRRAKYAQGAPTSSDLLPEFGY